MPTANGNYHGNGQVVYDDYETSSHDSERGASGQWNHDANGTRMNGGNHDFKGLPNGTSPHANPRDEIGQHMLYETAMLDAKDYGLLSLEEVDSLKKELARLVPRHEAAQRKLTLELKVRGAAQNLQRLNSVKGARADTPQTPDSPPKDRDSMDNQVPSHAEEELATSQRKIDELYETVKQLGDRRAEVDRMLLRHTAAVLAEQCERSPHGNTEQDDDAVSTYEPDAYDGIRDILGGRTISKSSARVGGGPSQAEHEEQLQSIQDRLERFNEDLRAMITDAAKNRGVSLPPEPFPDHIDDPAARLTQDLERLGTNLQILDREHQESNQYTTKSIERQLGSVNNALHDSLSTAKSDQPSSQPPPVAGQSYTEQLAYLQGLVNDVHAITQSHVENTGMLAKSAGDRQKLAEYESTVTGLWEVIQSDGSSRPHSSVDTTPSPPKSPFLQDSFSLAAFNSRVQHIHDKATSAKDQHNILLRQVQQQRELNGKSDAEKDKQIETLQTNHDQIVASHGQLQDEFAQVMAKHATSETEASHLRSELANIENEIEELKKLAQTKSDQHSAAQNEVVRLTTELTMTKAELEGAYGSRAERAKEAQGGEVEALKARSASLEQELAGMTSEFQELTRESLELERERSHLDTLIDGLRERCETLEAQLADEKVRLMGMKSPGPGADATATTNANANANAIQPREQTSTSVMRQEFKKMMRDARAEGVKLLRAEQEERRKLEGELRRIRQANTPLGKSANTAQHTAQA